MALPPPWDAYMRLQSTLHKTTEINNRSWGLEASLDAILDVEGLTPNLPTATATATAERRERHRARLRRTYPSALWPVVNQAIEARVELDQLRRLLEPSDWQVISSVGAGMSYHAISRELAATPSSLRARVSRIRDSLPLAA